MTVPHTFAEHGTVVTVPCQWAQGCAFRLQRKAFHRQFTRPHSKYPPSPPVLPLCLWQGSGRFGVCGAGPAQEGWHSAEVTLHFFLLQSGCAIQTQKMHEKTWIQADSIPVPLAL